MTTKLTLAAMKKLWAALIAICNLNCLLKNTLKSACTSLPVDAMNMDCL